MKPADFYPFLQAIHGILFLNLLNFLMIHYLLLPDEDEEEDERLPPELLDLTLEPELLFDDPLLR